MPAPKDSIEPQIEDGYNWFGRYPKKVLPFLDKYMK